MEGIPDLQIIHRLWPFIESEPSLMNEQSETDTGSETYGALC
jgi:hypothetical protein